MFYLFVLLFASWCSLTWAHGQIGGNFCFRACDYSLNNVVFDDTDTDLAAPKFVRGCTSFMKTSSLYLCLEFYCTPESRSHGLFEYQHVCLEHANITLPSFDHVVANYTHEELHHLRQIEPLEVTRKALTLGEVALPSYSLFHSAFNTLKTAHYEHDLHITYGWAMVYFWTIVVTIGLSTRLLSLIASTQKRGWQALPDSEGGSPELSAIKAKPGILTRPHTWLKRFITVPATFGYRCSQNIRWCTIPPRIQSLTIASFVIINIVLCSVNYFAFPGNLYWPKVSTQLWRYISDRTGVISFANLPLVWLFGTRNNVLMWITGWGFGTYNSFHRWVARVATVQAVVHSIGYTVLVCDSGGWAEFKFYMTKKYWQFGEIATVAMVAICVFSVYGLRRSFYEIFLFLHIVISVVVLVGVWYHVEIFEGEYDGYIWPCALIWFLDRLFRWVRVISFNPRVWGTKATVTYDSDSNIVRLVIPYSTSYLKPVPGAYYYLYLLNDFRIWENHPFTLAYATGATEQNNPLTPVPPTPDTPAFSNESESETLLTPSSHAPPSSLVFLIRPYDGMTSRLRASAFHRPRHPRILVEGPYGHSEPFHTFPSILFIVGGTGIATPLSHIERLLTHDDDTRTHAVHIVWAVREHAFLADVLRTDLAARGLLHNDRLRITAYVTQDVADKPPAAAAQGEDADNNDDQGNTWPHGVSVRCGRPDVAAEVDDAADEAGDRGLAVVACGPAQMADEARRAVVGVLGKGCARVEYFEESFKW